MYIVSSSCSVWYLVTTSVTCRSRTFHIYFIHSFKDIIVRHFTVLLRNADLRLLEQIDNDEKLVRIKNVHLRLYVYIFSLTVLGKVLRVYI